MDADPSIEDLAQTQFKYTKLFEDQAAILRKDPVVYQTAYDNVYKSELVSKEGQPWMPKPDERDAYMRFLEGICEIEPKTPDDRMKICFAAHAFLACFVLFYTAQLSSADRTKVIKRFTELQTAELAHLPASFIPPSLRPEPGFPALKVHRSHKHKITKSELQAFLNDPLSLLGKQFILGGEGQAYEVVKFETSKEKAHCYGVQFEDCAGVIELDSDEMQEHLQESYLIDSSE